MVKYPGVTATLSAIADPTRRRILERLGDGPATVSELAQPLDITLPGLLKHIRVLEGAALVKTHKSGRTRWCALGSGDLDDAAEWIEKQRRRWERRLDRFENYLKEEDPKR